VFLERCWKHGIWLTKGRTLPLFPIAHVWVFLLFLFYLAGSSAYMDGFVGLAVLVPMFTFVRKRNSLGQDLGSTTDTSLNRAAGTAL